MVNPLVCAIEHFNAHGAGHGHDRVKGLEEGASIRVGFGHSALRSLRSCLDDGAVGNAHNQRTPTAEGGVHGHVLVHRADKLERPVSPAKEAVHRLSDDLLAKPLSVGSTDEVASLTKRNSQRVGAFEELNHVLEQTVKLRTLLS